MPHTTVDQALQSAIKQHQAGQLAQAEGIYRQILDQQPSHADALHLLGLIAHQKGQNQSAIELIRRAISIRSNWPEAYYNLGIALSANDQIEDAIAAFRQAVTLNPNFADAFNSLGTALRQKGKPSDAAQAYYQAVLLKPGYPDAYNNLGNALRDSGQIDQAITAYQQAIALRPNYPQAFNNLAVALHDSGHFEKAIATYQKTIALKPDYAEACNNLGISLREHGQLPGAIASHERAISLRPAWAEAHYCLGNALVLQGELDQSIAAYQRAISLKPGYAQAHYNLGKSLIDAGDVEAAIPAFQRAIEFLPEDSSFESALLFAMYYQAESDPQSIAQEHFNWGHRHADPLEKLPATRQREGESRLRVGYVSPDFRNHPVGRFMLPLLEHHDTEKFELFCYSDVVKPDEITARLTSSAQHWREIAKLKHEQLAEQIREDAIDILVDLTGHSTASRLLTFARKPAPVQVSYLGYPGTTGVSAIDYRLTDNLADPPGLTEQYHSESLFRLPQSNWCFAEHEASPPIVPPPMMHAGYVTFGSFNNFAKVTESMLQAWATLLLKVPDSHLLLKAMAFISERARERAGRVFVQRGINLNRITLVGPQPDHASHLQTYNQIDIALDTFPYHGTTTTCDALWMGVPVIVLAGQSHASRVGVSLLNSVGLPELIATSTEQYIHTAASLGVDQDRLQWLRLKLRDRMRQSSLMDSGSFARNIERAYQQMWTEFEHKLLQNEAGT